LRSDAYDNCTARIPRWPTALAVRKKGCPMFLIVAIVLVVLWVLGAFVFRIIGGLVHLLLIIALIALVLHFVRGHP